MVICLERGADLHMAQLMPLPLTVSCFSKIQIGFTVWYRLTRMCVCVHACVRACVCVCVCVFSLLADQGLRNGGASLRQSVRSFARCYPPLRRVCCCAPRKQEISIDCCTAGAQQQRRRSTALSCKREQRHVRS